MAVGDVRVAVDEAGQHGHRRKVDDLGPGRNREPLTDALNLVVVNEDDLIGQDGSRIRIDEAPCLDHRLFGKDAVAAEYENGGHQQTGSHTILLIQ